MSILDDLWSWLTTSPGVSAGGSAGGTPYLGPASPTGSTQTPPAVATAPALGGPPVSQGLLSGLLGGQQPANPMSYFTPRQGLLGNSPLGMGLRGGLAGLAAGAGQGGLSGFGAGAMGGQQEEMQRRQNQMATLAAGQQYQGGQQQLIQDAIRNQQLVQQINVSRRIAGGADAGFPDVTLNDILTHPDLISNPTGGQTQTATTAPATASTTANPPIIPTAQITNPNVKQAYPPGTAQFPPTSPIVTTQLPTSIPASGFRPPLALGGTVAPPAAPQQPPAQPPAQTITAQPPQQPSARPTIAPPAQTAAAPSSQAGGTFTMPRTIQELEASNLPNWAKEELQPAYWAAQQAGSYQPIYDAWKDVITKLQAPAQAAATKQAEVLATEDLRPNQVKALGDVQSKYMADPVTQAMQTARPIYRAGFAAYQNEQKKPSTQNELDLINSALQMMDNKAQPLRIGSADSLRQAENLPDLLYKSFKKLVGGGQLQPEETNALMDIINSHYKGIEASYNVNLGNYRQQAEFSVGAKPGAVPDALWRPDTPPPPPTPEIGENPTTHEKIQGTYEWDGEKWVRTGWQPI